jgi:hypothetical protein
MTYMTQNLIQRGHSWSVRYIVPTENRAIVGKKEIVRALGTRDLNEARKIRHAVLAQIITDVENLVNPAKSILEDAQAHALEIATSSTPEIIKNLAVDKAESIEKAHGEHVAQQYADVALRGSMPVKAAGDQWLKSQEGKVTQGTVDGIFPLNE